MRAKLLALALFLLLVALGVRIVEVLPSLQGDGDEASALGDDVLVMRLGAPPTETAPAAADPDLYVVRKGDTLSSIAARHLGSAARAGDLARLNGLSDPNALEVGQRLRLR